MLKTNDCNTAIYNANVATSAANTAAGRANTAAETIENMTVTSESVGPDSLAEAILSEVSGHKNIHFKLKQGANGAPYIIKGNAYASVDALEEAITSPAIGDQYNVGTSAPYNVYRWTGTTWEDQGKIGISVLSMSTEEIDSIWNGTAIESADRKFLDHTGLFHLIKNKIKAAFDKKVDKVDGKGLSSKDFTQDYIDQIESHESSISALVNTKVDKVGDKMLSTNDFTNAYKNQVDQNKTDIASLKDGKVDKVEGKGLSTNDFTDDYKDQVDQNKSDISELRESKVDKIPGKVLSTNDFTDAYKNKIDELMEIIDVLARTRTIWREMEDSSSDSLTDSDGNPISGRVIFAQL